MPTSSSALFGSGFPLAQMSAPGPIASVRAVSLHVGSQGQTGSLQRGACSALVTQSGRMDRDHFEYVTSISVRKGANADTSFNGVTLMV